MPKTSARVGREAPRYLLRLPPDLREQLQKEANINGRSVNSEIVRRLQRSMEPVKYGVGVKASEPPPRDRYLETDPERSMLAVFRRLSSEKQLALLSLFK